MKNWEQMGKIDGWLLAILTAISVTMFEICMVDMFSEFPIVCKAMSIVVVVFNIWCCRYLIKED